MYNKDNKKLSRIKKLKENTQVNNFYVNTIVFYKNNIWKLKPKKRCEIFVAIFYHNF